MYQKKYTLPRHTNLAKQSSRFSAFLVDFALLIATTLVFYFGCFNLIFTLGVTNTMYDQLDVYILNSNLKYKDENGEFKIYDSTTSKEKYAEVLEYYYFNYCTGVDIDVGKAAPNYNVVIKDGDKDVLPKDYYTIEWYNKNILKITDDDPDRETSTMYFTYQKDSEDHYDKTKIGIPRTHRVNPDVGAVVELTDQDIVNFYQKRYVETYDHLVGQKYYLDVVNPIGFFNTLSIVLSFIVSSMIVYVLFPYIFKNGKTIGKLIFKLGLANLDGYKISNYQLWTRLIPLVLVSLAMLIPIFTNIIAVVTVVLVILLVSFALAMASPKKTSLHDFTGQTIVVDYKSSIIFENELEEEEYIYKEDNPYNVKPVEVESDGEEPELKYEK